MVLHRHYTDTLSHHNEFLSFWTLYGIAAPSTSICFSHLYFDFPITVLIVSSNACACACRVCFAFHTKLHQQQHHGMGYQCSTKHSQSQGARQRSPIIVWASFIMKRKPSLTSPLPPRKARILRVRVRDVEYVMYMYLHHVVMLPTGTRDMDSGIACALRATNKP